MRSHNSGNIHGENYFSKTKICFYEKTTPQLSEHIGLKNIKVGGKQIWVTLALKSLNSPWQETVSIISTNLGVALRVQANQAVTPTTSTAPGCSKLLLVNTLIYNSILSIWNTEILFARGIMSKCSTVTHCTALFLSRRAASCHGGDCTVVEGSSWCCSIRTVSSGCLDFLLITKLHTTVGEINQFL